MSASPTPQFEIPTDMRKMTEQSMEQVKTAISARGAHSVRIGPTTASNLCSRVADRAPHKTTLAFPAPPITFWEQFKVYASVSKDEMPVSRQG